ncbi:MAG: extracellular solute-binding protein [Myxococcales bacterium]|nr:extracellular solute-binding protein [Myxococcales bacterium]
MTDSSPVRRHRASPVSALALALALLASTSGCGKKPMRSPVPEPTAAGAGIDPNGALAATGTAAPATALPAAPVAVKLWHSYRDDERKALDQLVVHWNRNHAEVQIDALAVPYDAIIDKFQVAAPRGNGPDLIVIAHDKIGGWARSGLIQPLGDFATPERLQRFLPQTVKPLVFERALYGLPLAFKTLAMFYNKNMVSGAPTTLAQLIEVAKVMTKPDDGQFGFAYDAGDLYFHAPFLLAGGGAVWDEATQKMAIDTPAARAGIQVARDLVQVHKIVPKGMSGFVITAMFNDGKAPFVMQGPWFIPEIAANVQWGVALLPDLEPGKPMRPFLGSEALLLTQTTPAKEAALRVLDYLTSDEAALTRLEVGRQMVANAKVYENPRWLNDPVVKVFRAQAELAVPMSNAAETNVAWNPYNTALRKTIFGDAKIDAALAEAQKACDEAVAQLGK